jgi:hypothetical protein
MFTDFTTAETLAHHRAAELERRIDMAHHQAERLGMSSASRPEHSGWGQVVHVFETLHLARPHHAAASH